MFAAKQNVRVLRDRRSATGGTTRSTSSASAAACWCRSPDAKNVAPARTARGHEAQPTPQEMRRPDVRLARGEVREVERDRVLRRRHDARRRRRPDEPRRLARASPRIKAQNAGLSLAGSAVASDAFFPFRDGLDVVVDAGATCVIQPGGSMRDEEVIAAADERGIAMVFTGMRHFRH